VLASPVAGSIAEKAGLRGGERSSGAAFDGEAAPGRPLLRGPALAADARRPGRPRPHAGAGARRPARAARSGAGAQHAGRPEADAAAVPRNRHPGALDPPRDRRRHGRRRGRKIRPAQGRRGAAHRRYLPIVDGQQLREVDPRPGAGGKAVRPKLAARARRPALACRSRRTLKPEGGRAIGRIGAYVGAPPDMVTVRYGFVDGLWQGAVRTWEVSCSRCA
jgi:regulator of sigma E protease